MMNVLLVGAGLMAGEYANVLNAMNIKYTVVGRSENSAKRFKETQGVPVIIGGLESLDDGFLQNYSHAIVATTLESLEDNVLYLLDKGMKEILVEKPGAVTEEGIERINKLSKKYEAKTYIAYNRRFYSSIMEARKRIEEDGGLTSFLFEFTEWTHIIEKLNKTAFQLNNLFIGNSTHVVDAAFYIGGLPRELQGYTQSKLVWHQKGSIFVGAGITMNDIPFSYHANWNAPGSWKLELLTNKNRFIFRPFEQLHTQKIGSTAIEQVTFDDHLDTQFKPGLYRQLEQFLLGGDYGQLLSIEDAARTFHWFYRILGQHGGSV
ncbi:MAG: Gfo/Idh/MocA family oxidoreductase [Candidatus Pristimantibacillus lignocellulolyticus]|uniref:Gfo/Idh/MocA family oxidoreductase n=1 Tax=Candidatus Pristimantibacillus lignocellulolyticus TaxID=2994561 RepID=A0A9J6ZJA0_9BACL|nr:MAG: Gfo/Idh/MocA family oxidoreductase [Candidatus Pristimantibacillus lignocellulolyticus]